MLIIKSRFTFVFITILILLGCKSEKQIQQLKNHLLLTEDGFYFRKNEIYSSDEYLLLKFYKNGHLSELSTSQNNLGILKNSKDFTCLLDELSNPPTNYYLVKGDSIFFKKKAWDSYEYANLKFECKTYKDSIVAKITPIDYYDSTNASVNKHPKSIIATYLYKAAKCDTSKILKIPQKN
ncbi:MAG: hypothetical protein ACK5QC_07080 [Bacteroidota bacterium]|jgi:hypothetical protein